MKANAGKRKIFDAVDLLTEDTSAQVAEIKNGIEQIKIDDIQAFHDHPFHLYEGERLQDMVQSIKEHGILIKRNYFRLLRNQRITIIGRGHLSYWENLMKQKRFLTLMVKSKCKSSSIIQYIHCISRAERT